MLLRVHPLHFASSLETGTRTHITHIRRTDVKLGRMQRNGCRVLRRGHTQTLGKVLEEVGGKGLAFCWLSGNLPCQSARCREDLPENTALSSEHCVNRGNSFALTQTSAATPGWLSCFEPHERIGRTADLTPPTQSRRAYVKQESDSGIWKALAAVAPTPALNDLAFLKAAYAVVGVGSLCHPLGVCRHGEVGARERQRKAPLGALGTAVAVAGATEARGNAVQCPTEREVQPVHL